MKIGDKLKQIIAAVAPSIGAALGGPLGGLAGTYVSQALGTDDGDAALAKLNADPQAIVALKQADIAFQAHLDDNKIELEKIMAGDRADARARQVAVHDNMPAQVLYLTAFGFFGTLLVILWRGLPTSGGEVVLTMVGVLGTAFVSSVAYFVGTNRQSATKDQTIAAIAQSP